MFLEQLTNWHINSGLKADMILVMQPLTYGEVQPNLQQWQDVKLFDCEGIIH